VMVVLPPSPLMSSPLVLASSDRDLVYQWALPDDLLDALSEGRSFIWREDGFPELGLEGECLASVGSVESPLFKGTSYAYIGFKPMGGQVAAIRSFYGEQVRKANIKLGMVLEGSIIAIILIIFLLLNYLLRRRLTGPIEGLSQVADRLAEGDLDVHIEVHRGSAVEGLERAFKALVDNLRRYVAWSVGEHISEPESAGGRGASRLVDSRYRILLEITAIIVAVMLVAGLGIYLILRQTQDRLLDETVDLMVETGADDLISFLEYAAAASIPTYMDDFKSSSLQEFANDVDTGRISGLQEKIVYDMQLMTSLGCHGLQKVFLVVPRSSFNPECVVWASNDRALIYCQELPEEFTQAMEEDQSYLLLEEGIPRMGCEGEFLVTFNRVENPLTSILPFYYIAAKPMQGEMDFIYDFCGQERDKANLYLGSLLGMSIVLAIVITFFFLNHLITKQITRPVEDLSAAAEKVMQGDLDVKVEVQEGEALQGLKRAFNEMVDSIRRLILKD
jgi:HAMP domain-containing protein